MTDRGQSGVGSGEGYLGLDYLHSQVFGKSVRLSVSGPFDLKSSVTAFETTCVDSSTTVLREGRGSSPLTPDPSQLLHKYQCRPCKVDF